MYPVSLILFALWGQTPTSSSTQDVHAPPVEGPISIDWVRFASGEWHNGECKGVTIDSIEFDADQSGLDTWDWDDVTDLYLPGTSEYVFEDKTVLRGSGQVTPDEVIILTVAGQVRRPRSELLRIVVGVERELSRWSFDLGVTLSANAGNTQNVNLGARTALVRRGRTTRINFGYEGEAGAANTLAADGFQTNVFNHKGTSSFDWFFTRRLYWRTYDVYVKHDRFQDISVETRPSSGLGMQLVDAKTWSLDGLIGGAFQSTNFISDTTSINTGGVLAIGVLEWDLTPDVDLTLEERFFGDLRVDAGDNLTQLLSKLDLDIDFTSVFDFIVAFQHTYKVAPQGQSPAISEERGIVQNDFSLKFGIELSLGT